MRRYRSARIGDVPLFVFVITLAIFGILMIYSAGVVDVPNKITAGAWRNQMTWFALSMVAIAFVMRVPVAWIEWAAQPAYAFCVVLLVLTLFIGGGGEGVAASEKSWIRWGPLTIQTSEIAKIGVVLMLARVLGEWREPPQMLWALWKPVAVVMLPMGLVLLQPDLGTGLVFTSILIWALFWAGTPLMTLFFLVSPVFSLFLSIQPWVWGAYVILLIGVLFFRRGAYLSEKVTVFALNLVAGAIALPLWQHLKPYQKNRLIVFLDPSVDPRGAGYNLIQSRVAIGSGGWLGKGFTLGTQKRLAFIPEQHTDFIFSVVGEELGFIGVLVILLLFGLVFWRLVKIAERSSDPFASMVPFGLFGSWFAHVLVNVGMTVGIMPITGIPLPFVSYGGSFLLVNLTAMAVVQRIAAETGRG